MLVGGERINLGLPEVAPSGKGILSPISTCFAHLLHNIMGYWAYLLKAGFVVRLLNLLNVHCVLPRYFYASFVSYFRFMHKPVAAL